MQTDRIHTTAYGLRELIQFLEPWNGLVRAAKMKEE
jgi:hypothetical protein